MIRHACRTIHDADFFGPIRAVVANGPVVCLTISRSGFQKLLRKEPGISAALLQELAARLRAADAATQKQPVTE
jgi:CRP-like cAMP-binding protein